MFEHADDADLLRRTRQFREDVERKIAEANREVLHEQIAELDTASFVELAKQVARMRALYLKAALAAASKTDPAELVQDLRTHREAYEEARTAFEALQRVIQRGYVDIGTAA